MPVIAAIDFDLGALIVAIENTIYGSYLLDLTQADERRVLRDR